jgi:phosphatidylserine/phosphatidylglycerophosphate/cardiolipin synthase-like enzyme
MRDLKTGVLSAALVAVLLCAGTFQDASAVNIIDLHNNTSTGVPAAPYTIGTVVTITGIVTVPDSVFNTYSTDCYIQDDTGGLDIFVSAGLNGGLHFKLGDNVTVTAKVAQFNGLTEIGTTLADVTLVTNSTGNPVPDPLVMTCAQLNSSFYPNYSEPNESRLIRINGVQIVGGTWPVTPSASNVSIQISDGTGTVLLYIDKDCGANGTPEPVGYFDVIGIHKQYDTTSPYTTGYEILPRFATDIVQQGYGPIITGGPEEDDPTTNSTTIRWTTNTLSSTIVEYGLTSAYGSILGDSVTLVTEHAMPLTGLAPNTVYHYRVSSVDGTGRRFSNDRVFATVSDLASEIHLYFNRSVDQSYSKGYPALGNQSLSTKLIERINAADYTIDCCFYSFSLSQVTDALIAAKNRGVQVRFIIEVDNSGSFEVSRLTSAGIPVITSTFGGNHGAAQNWGINHNKFAVFDCPNATSKADDWVWTGSWNCSISGNDDANNALMIQDYGLASAYEIEFNEMWGSETATPDANYARMGNRKFNNTPHKFTIQGYKIQQYMSPSDATESRIIDEVNAADSTLYFCILSFTSNELSAAMKAKYHGIPGFQVRGVFDSGSIGTIEGGSEWYALNGDPGAYNYWNPRADVFLDALPSGVLLHHKYLIIDSSWPLLDPTVVTGSHNWSYSANTVNDENTLILHSVGIANVYLQEFAARYHEAGGAGQILVGVDDLAGSPGAITPTFEAFPNPFNPLVNLRYTLPSNGMVSLKIYDIMGRLVRTIVDKKAEIAGFHSVSWDGRDSAGKAAASGVYVVQLESGTFVKTVKAILLK